ncbi:transporter [Terrimonas sp.]|uniref:TolC family protein n=1 Tax=Terrimonas sp. TaxID=1914338 RepID=UPI000D5173F0|nr:TolC family protein [Terrimonas sp.]PVD50250.1 transporter [Terrimonas sp.]
MKKVKLLVAVCAGILTGNIVTAQETLTLQQALKFAIEHKAEAQKARLEVENAQYLIDEVKGSALPQVNGSGTLTYNPMLQKSALPGEIIGKPGETVMVAFGQKWQSNAVLSVNQQLFNQSIFTGLKAARTTKEFYQINKTLTDEQLIEKVADAYYQVFQLQQQLQTVQTNLDNTTKTQKIISGLVDAGLSKKIDLDRIVVAVNNLEAAKQQMVNSLQLSENALKFAIGMEMDKDIILPAETFEVNAAILADQPDVLNRTEIKLLSVQSDLLQLNKKAKAAEYYPSLSFTGNLGYLGMGPYFPVFNNSSKVNWSGFSGLGLNLSIPIFNGGTTKAKINQANIDIKKLDVEINDTKLALALASENARSQINNSLLTVNTNKRNISLAKDVLDNTQNNYKNGLATLTDLLDAEKAYADAQNNLTISLLSYKVAEIQLIKANGNLKSLLN